METIEDIGITKTKWIWYGTLFMFVVAVIDSVIIYVKDKHTESVQAKYNNVVCIDYTKPPEMTRPGTFYSCQAQMLYEVNKIPYTIPVTQVDTTVPLKQGTEETVWYNPKNPEDTGFGSKNTAIVLGIVCFVFFFIAAVSWYRYNLALTTEMKVVEGAVEAGRTGFVIASQAVNSILSGQNKFDVEEAAGYRWQVFWMFVLGIVALLFGIAYARS